MPEKARWGALLAAASQPDIAKHIDEALELIENDNPRLRSVLPRIYARAPLSTELMGSLVETISKIGFGKGAKEARDILGRIYEYFIKEFAHFPGRSPANQHVLEESSALGQRLSQHDAESTHAAWRPRAGRSAPPSGLPCRRRWV